MFTGFEKLVEQKIKKAQKEGEFVDLPGSGKPLVKEDIDKIPEDLRLAYRILKNSNCIPPEVEVKKQIRQTEDLLGSMEDTAEKYRVLKKRDFLILKLNSLKRTSADFDVPQKYMNQVVDVLENKKDSENEI